ncbi:MAG: tRNA (adenosine(37)-N6)-dimethylallyltransferase MiaA [Lentisphaeria bacterium]|nr:tRNA (adenosine(37)-N6)-dimethylallyltransferase MiaA [Lentisphaeria bacterium]
MKLIVITGPTASGKTALAVKLARKLNGEIISADSRQVYRGLDIGSGKDLSEYGTGADRVPAHLLDIADPAEKEQFSLADFMREAKIAAADISARGKVPLICGGTALYLDALIRGYELPGGAADREFRNAVKSLSAEKLSKQRNDQEKLILGEENNPYRNARKLEIQASAQKTAEYGGPIPGAEFLIIGAFRPRAEVRDRIEKRLDERLDQGMMDEIRSLHESGVSWERMEAFGLEYRELSAVFSKGVSLQDARNSLLIKIRQFAKRQDTWFRKMEREGLPIYWIPPEEIQKAENLCRKFLSGEELPPPEFQLERNPK